MHQILNRIQHQYLTEHLKLHRIFLQMPAVPWTQKQREAEQRLTVSDRVLPAYIKQENSDYGKKKSDLYRLPYGLPDHSGI